MGTIVLREGHVRPVWAGHPWVFAQAVARVDGAPALGDWVRVMDPKGNFVGAGFYAPKSSIAVRLVTRNPDEDLNLRALIRRLEIAAKLRSDLGFPNPETTGFRMVNGSGDDLPGLVVDVFGKTAIIEVSSAGMERNLEPLLSHIQRICGVESVLRTATRSKAEGIDTEFESLRGVEPKELCFRERGFEYVLPMDLQQKTGFYFDQRETRSLVEEVARERVLDAYSYIGAIGMAAARGGARSVRCLDSSPVAVAVGGETIARNGLSDRVRFERADIKKRFPELQSKQERYDLVVIDPPKLIPTRRHFQAGRRAYSRLNELACRLTIEGGLLLTCSCSAAMTQDVFLDTVAAAAKKARRHVTLLKAMGAGPDHPSQPAFRQGRYLTSLLLRVQ